MEFEVYDKMGYNMSIFISTIGPLALWLIWVSRVGVGCDMKIDIYNNLIFFRCLKM
jgi:hypothetical protein